MEHREYLVLAVGNSKKKGTYIYLVYLVYIETSLKNIDYMVILLINVIILINVIVHTIQEV